MKKFMKEFTEEQFNEWVDRLYNECVKVTKFTCEDVEYLYYTEIGCFRKQPNLLYEFVDTQQGKLTGTCSKFLSDFIITFNNGYFRLINLKNGKSGWSKKSYCEPKFDSKVALAVAFARYCKNEIPKVEKLNRIINFEKIKSGTEIFYSGTSSWRTVKFISIDPDDPSQIILKVTYTDGTCKLVYWYLNTRQDGYFYTKEL